jgi:hypothetical protein
VISPFLNRDTQGAEKVYILGVKRLATRRVFARGSLKFRNRLLFYLVQPNRRLQHKKHIKALFADVLHNLGNLLGFGNRLMDGFPELLDKTTKSLIQRSTPTRHLQARFYLP